MKELERGGMAKEGNVKQIAIKNLRRPLVEKFQSRDPTF